MGPLTPANGENFRADLAVKSDYIRGAGFPTLTVIE